MPRINRGKLFLLSNLFFIGGILAGRFFATGISHLWPILFLPFTLLFLAGKEKQRFFLSAGFVLLAFSLGVFRLNLEKDNSAEDYICDLDKENVAGYGILQKCQSKNQEEIKCQLGSLEIEKATGLKIYKGKLLASFPNQITKDYQFGNKLKFSGLIEKPENFNGFDYQGYLRKDGIYALLKNQENSVVVGGKLAAKDLSAIGKFQRLISSARIGLEKKFIQLWEGESLGLMKALLLGDKSYFSDNLTESFQKVGISHLVAISGMHITIITDLLLSFFFLLGFYRRVAFGGVILALVSFIFLIGLPASAVRALLMGSLGFSAKLLGRKIQANNLLFFTASLMLFQNPLLIFHDVGFQLSFCAVWGIFNFMPALENFFNPLLKFRRISQAVSMSIAAQLATFPIAFYHFHYFSLISVPANVLVFWSVFPIIFLGIFALGFSFLNLGLADFFALLAQLGTSYLIGVTEKMSGFQWSGIEAYEIKWGWVGLLVLASLLFLIKSTKEKDKKLIFAQ